jgi:hypothetical protein
MRIIISFLAIILFTGCINKTKIPAEVLSQDKMRNVIWDLMRADEFIDKFTLKDSTLVLKEERIKLYEQVFQLHGTSRETFKQSLTFYESRPDLLKPVTDSLRVNEKKALQNQFNPQKPGIDSLKNKARINATKFEKEK